MSKKYRLVFLGISLMILVSVGYFTTSNFSFLLDDFWFTSGFLLLILLSLIDQPHFSKDSNIFINAVAAGISLLLIDSSGRDITFWIFLGITIYLVVSSYILLWVRKDALTDEPVIVQMLSRMNRIIGRPEALFSSFFLWGAIKQFGVSSNQFNALLLYWVIFMILNTPALAKSIESICNSQKEEQDKNAIGRIFGVQSKNTFLVKLADQNKRKSIKLFDFVEFKYSIDEKIRQGILLDTYLLNQEQWVKVLANREIEAIFNNSQILSNHTTNIVYKLTDIPTTDYLDRFVGIVTEDSKIGKIKFIFNSKININEGQLLEAIVSNQKVLYQIVEGITRIEQLEHKNQSALIIGEAVQLGTWNPTKYKFEQFGWVPQINSPVYLASKIDDYTIEEDEFITGYIPNTNYPVILNKKAAMSHHMAIIGVTGTGKSVFARNLIREFLNDKDAKVICIDFTGEYIGKFKDLKPAQTISSAIATQLFQDIDFIEKEIANNYNKDTDKSIAKKKEVSLAINSELEKFLKGDSQLSIFELPHVENTSGVLTYTKTFFRILFHIAKHNNNFGKRICLVLEEAHTIVPEWNFSGVSDKISQPLLNSISQIALQGRKYNVGLLVIAQRTANVSKTILTQCNTIISFQEFDKTSSDFLANYFGQEIVNSLPKLKFRQAIAAGKAFRSSVPMIFEVPEIIEK
ncbi:MAG: DUF87 domain-containing protein [Candidatus Omnitrophica bacterium]|nr:DUF87 domain-containing protein [Candidatus Omnitrophota bacterium]